MNPTQKALLTRFSDAPELEPTLVDPLHTLISRGSCRDFQARDVPEDVVKALCAAALSSPTKSDLQGRDIVVLTSDEKRNELAGLVSGQKWVGGAPVLLVFCGNNRRQRLIHELHGIPFENDHLDAFFNAACDAAIALGACVAAATALGLGSCPISAVRNEAAAVSDLLELPDHVFPVAGLALGYPGQPPEISSRLPLSVTCHMNRFSEDRVQQSILDYDAERSERQPYDAQRFEDRFGTSKTYGWSEDKARQYAAPERADFGRFVRAKGFSLD